MNTQKKQLLRWIDEDKDLLIGFLSKFLQAKSPNPPGDTRDAAKVITDFLREEGLPYRIIAPKKEMVNIARAPSIASLAYSCRCSCCWTR